MAKEPFKWDTDKILDEVQESDKVNYIIRECTLNEVEWISIQKLVLKQTGWEVAKNQNFKREVFMGIVDLFK